MADKAQLIKEEIERRIENLSYLIPDVSNIGNLTMEDVGYYAKSEALKSILQFIDSLPEEPASEDLDEEIERFLDEDENIPSYSKTARHFAEWQKQQMKETLQTEYEKGRFDMREEMMKDAVKGTVKYEIGSAEIPQCDKRYQVLSDQVHIPNAKLGDKVKVLILKTE